jgi:hypothetical protein
MIAPCELVRIPNVRLVRSKNKPMEYVLEQATAGEVKMLRWQDNAGPRQADPLQESVSLADLADLADRPDTEIARWVSKWGMLGFRPSDPQFFRHHFAKWILLGEERRFGPEHRSGYGYEPIELIKEAAKVARAARVLFSALKPESVRDRASMIRKIIKPNPDVRVGNEMEMFAREVFIGKHPLPKKPVEWDRLAVAGLGFLTDCYLEGEFQLYWATTRARTRELCLGWKVNSLLAALYLKLGYRLRQTLCQTCGVPIGHRRLGTKTCGPTCRQLLKREKDKIGKES